MRVKKQQEDILFLYIISWMANESLLCTAGPVCSHSNPRLMDLIVLPVFKTLSRGNARLNAASTACWFDRITTRVIIQHPLSLLNRFKNYKCPFFSCLSNLCETQPGSARRRLVTRCRTDHDSHVSRAAPLHLTAFAFFFPYVPLKETKQCSACLCHFKALIPHSFIK